MAGMPAMQEQLPAMALDGWLPSMQEPLQGNSDWPIDLFQTSFWLNTIPGVTLMHDRPRQPDQPGIRIPA